MEVAAHFRPAAVEAVPAATQLAALSFAAAIAGCLSSPTNRARVVLHRVMSRAGQTYLQQTSPYAGKKALDHAGSGRVFSFSTGVMGYALKHRQIAHTKLFATDNELDRILERDLKSATPQLGLADVARSYVAIPMLGADGNVATLLYADSWQYGQFADEAVVKTMCDMCQGFCNIMDQVIESPLPYIENFAMDEGTPVTDTSDLFVGIQELMPKLPLPKYAILSSLNLEMKRY